MQESKHVGTTIDYELWHALAVTCAQKKTKISAVLRQAIQDFISEASKNG